MGSSCYPGVGSAAKGSSLGLWLVSCPGQPHPMIDSGPAERCSFFPSSWLPWCGLQHLLQLHPCSVSPSAQTPSPALLSISADSRILGHKPPICSPGRRRHQGDHWVKPWLSSSLDGCISHLSDVRTFWGCTVSAGNWHLALRVENGCGRGSVWRP